MGAAVPGLFVIGTDTGVGKTCVAAAIAEVLTREGRQVGVLKPVATGAIRQGDFLVSADAIALLAGIANAGDVEPARVAPIVFEEPLAPSVAARRLGEPLTHQIVLDATREALAWWAERADVMILEGIGGLLCPLAEGTTLADLAVALDYPLVIVARRGLGTLNHTLLTVEAARLRGLRIAGIVLNAPAACCRDLADATNSGELARRLEGVALLATLDHIADLSALSSALESVNWSAQAQPARSALR